MALDAAGRPVLLAVDPATGEALGEVPIASADQVKDAVRRARAAQHDWGARPVEERCKRLRPLLELMVDRRDALAALISREVGKPRYEALVTEVLPTLDLLDYYLRHAPDLLAPQRVKHRLLMTTRSELHHEPWGVVGAITPWNYPFFLPAAIGLGALFAGNAVVNKPSEFTPLVALELEKLVRDAGLPAPLWSCVPGEGPTGAALVEAGCDRISFTGSVKTGRRVAAACGERLIPVSLELGGKDAALVLDDADVDRAARALTWGAFTNAGQVCASVERIFVDERVARPFTEKLVEHTRALRQGADKAYDVDVGCMANRMQWEVVRRQVDEAKARGARVLTGGEGTAGEGEKARWFFHPTIIAGVAEDMAVQRDETFGPVVTVVGTTSDDEAVRLANASPYGLTASVWTKDEARATRLARRLHVGSVFVNDALSPSGAGEAPWGGVKDSGFGKTRGAHGLTEMSRVKHVAWDRFGLKDAPNWFPYSAEKYRLVSDVIPALFSVSPGRRVKAGFDGLTRLLGIRR